MLSPMGRTAVYARSTRCSPPRPCESAPAPHRECRVDAERSGGASRLGQRRHLRGGRSRRRLARCGLILWCGWFWEVWLRAAAPLISGSVIAGERFGTTGQLMAASGCRQRIPQAEVIEVLVMLAAGTNPGLAAGLSNMQHRPPRCHNGEERRRPRSPRSDLRHRRRLRWSDEGVAVSGRDHGDRRADRRAEPLS